MALDTVPKTEEIVEKALEMLVGKHSPEGGRPEQTVL